MGGWVGVQSVHLVDEEQEILVQDHIFPVIKDEVIASYYCNWVSFSLLTSNASVWDYDTVNDQTSFFGYRNL